MKKQEWKPDIVIYHAECSDGFGAAWAAFTKWGDVDVEYLPYKYNQTPPDVTDKKVLIVDFSFKPDVLFEMSYKANGIVVLDHHEGALQDFNACADIEVINFTGVDDPEYGLPPGEAGLIVYFDQNRSGAVLTWEFCFQNTPVPELLKFVQDRDLWSFQYPETKAFSIWLRSRPFDYFDWTNIAEALDSRCKRKELFLEANAMKCFYDLKVDELVKTHRWMYISGYHVPVCNAPYSFASDVAHNLLQLYPDAPFAASYADEGSIRKWSLRSDDDRENVFVISKKFGGGGHRNASGFTTPIC